MEPKPCRWQTRASTGELAARGGSAAVTNSLVFTLGKGAAAATWIVCTQNLHKVKWTLRRVSSRAYLQFGGNRSAILSDLRPPSSLNCIMGRACSYCCIKSRGYLYSTIRGSPLVSRWPTDLPCGTYVPKSASALVPNETAHFLNWKFNARQGLNKDNITETAQFHPKAEASVLVDTWQSSGSCVTLQSCPGIKTASPAEHPRCPGFSWYT